MPIARLPRSPRAISVALACAVALNAPVVETFGAGMLDFEILRDDADGRCGEGSPFAAYVERVGGAVARLGGTASHQPGKLGLTFVCMPLVKTAGSPTIEAVRARRGDGHETLLESPWLWITTNGETPAEVNAIFFWNERQMLIDQLILSGGEPSSAYTNAPLSPPQYEALLADYEESVLRAATPEDRDRAQATIGERIPADVLWLLRNAWQSTRGPFRGFVDDARQRLADACVEGSTDVAVALFERHAAAHLKSAIYITIRDLSDLLSVESLEINMMR